MKRVVIYGIRNRSKLMRIGQYLDASFEIVGYLDEAVKLSNNIFSGLPFYTLHTIFQQDYREIFDYVIIADAPDTKEIYNKFLGGGVNENCILDWSIAQNFLWENNLEVFKKHKGCYEGIITGMSYSYWGLFTSELSKPFFKLSMPALDLYYINKQLQEIINENYLGQSKSDSSNHRSNLRYVILDMPYYMFNYDLSMNRVHMINQLILADYFDDYHNFTTKANEKVLKQFSLWKEMIYDGIKYNSSYCYNDHIVRNGSITEEMKNACKNKISHVYSKPHPNTINENEKIFVNMMKLIKFFDKDIKVIILIMPQSKYEYIYHQKLIDSMAKDFHSVVSYICERMKINYEILDLYKEYFGKDEMFLDLIHLNSKGAKIFSNRLESLLKNSIYEK